ncbi:MAG: hypothetical protein AAB525_02350 [Patescibacteria group bacterium]
MPEKSQTAKLVIRKKRIEALKAAPQTFKIDRRRRRQKPKMPDIIKLK